MSSKSISLPGCNLYLKGAKTDRNGNKAVQLSFPNGRGFSIQTTGNLSKTGSILRGMSTVRQMETLTKTDLKTISREVCSYIRKYGTTSQKSGLRVYK